MPSTNPASSATLLDPAAEPWVVDQNMKRRFLGNFNRLDTSRSGSLPGDTPIFQLKLSTIVLMLTTFLKVESHFCKNTHLFKGSVVRMEFMKTGLATGVLKQIWSLSDITNSGSLSVDEFCVAMYLVSYQG